MQFTNEQLKKVPNPIKYRESTVELADGWLFSFDGETWQNINVPYAPQSELSGIGYTDFIYKCFYKKTFSVSPTDKRVIINFGAVDYECELFINGKSVGTHKGGYASFAFDITDFLLDGENLLLLEVTDNEENIPFGKQSYKQKSFGCFYTRTTGIWQPVWLELVPQNYIDSFRFFPNVERCGVEVELSVCGKGDFRIEVYYEGRKVGQTLGYTDSTARVKLEMNEKQLWRVGDGRLYDVKLEFMGDTVYSYFGLREVEYRGYDFFINGEKVYQKLVLDQGFYKKGVYTATVEELQSDIDFTLALGFNGARLHQRVFDPRYLYIADRMGVILWGEFASWGIDYTNLDSLDKFLTEWGDVMKRDFNHPAIIHWCPLNEVWAKWEDRNARRDVRYVDAVYEYTKAYDKTRPCVDTSGGWHGHKTDVFDFHSYDVPEELDVTLRELEEKGTLDHKLIYCPGEDIPYVDGTPVNLSEFGGIAFSSKGINEGGYDEGGSIINEDGWGYGNGETDEGKFIERYRALLEVIYRYEKLSGFCYTQLYDVEQEINGFRTYERKDKLSPEGIAKIKAINDAKY